MADRWTVTVETPWVDPTDPFVDVMDHRSAKSALYWELRRQGREPLWSSYESHRNAAGHLVASMEAVEPASGDR